MEFHIFSALLDIDFFVPSGSPPFNVTFNPMDIRREIILNITDDQFAEGNELIVLQLMNISSVIAIGQQTTMITIEDNDSKPLGSNENDICNVLCLASSSGDYWIQQSYVHSRRVWWLCGGLCANKQWLWHSSQWSICSILSQCRDINCRWESV